MTKNDLEYRVDRLEGALTALAATMTSNFPLRVEHSSASAVSALQEVVAEVRGRAETEAKGARRQALAAELTALDAA